MRYFSALCARMYRFSANSRATISSTAIFLSQQSRQYFSSPRGSETSFAPQSAHRDLATALRGIPQIYHSRGDPRNFRIQDLRISGWWIFRFSDLTTIKSRIENDRIPQAQILKSSNPEILKFIVPL